MVFDTNFRFSLWCSCSTNHFLQDNPLPLGNQTPLSKVQTRRCASLVLVFLPLYARPSCLAQLYVSALMLRMLGWTTVGSFFFLGLYWICWLIFKVVVQIVIHHYSPHHCCIRALAVVLWTCSCRLSAPLWTCLHRHQRACPGSQAAKKIDQTLKIPFESFWIVSHWLLDWFMWWMSQENAFKNPGFAHKQVRLCWSALRKFRFATHSPG